MKNVYSCITSEVVKHVFIEYLDCILDWKIEYSFFMVLKNIFELQLNLYECLYSFEVNNRVIVYECMMHR